MSTTRLSTRRAQRRSGSADGTPVQRPWRRVRNPYKPIEVLSADQIEFIHDASMEVLEELGLDIWSPEALAALEKAGQKVDHANQHVKFDRHWVMEMVAKAPSTFTV